MGLETREDEVKVKLAATPEPKVYLAPNMAEIYRQRVSELQQMLAAGSEHADALQAIRGLIDKVVLTPVEGALRIDLHGEAAAILQFAAAGKKGRFQLGQNAEQLVVVAGVRFEPTTFQFLSNPA